MENKPTRRWWSILKTAALVILAVGMGAAGVKAAEYYRDGWQADLIQARAQTRVELATYRLATFSDLVRKVTEEMEEGTASQIDLDYMRRELFQAENEHKLALLRLREIELSGREPDRSLYADLVQGEDFVSEALVLERMSIQDQLQLLFSHRRWLKDQPETSDQELRMLDRQILNVESSLERITHQLKLRERFLDGEIDPRQAQLEEQLVQARQNQNEIQGNLELMIEEITAARERVRNGESDGKELQYLRFEIMQQQAHLRLAQTELEILRRAAGME